MIYLLDTHTFIWTVLKTGALGSNVKKIISGKENEIVVSTVSFWEISLKTQIKKFTFDRVDIKNFPEYARMMEYTIIDMQEKETITFHELPQKKNHKDPFDRMLIWQAITGNMTMISKDAFFDQYRENGLKLIW